MYLSFIIAIHFFSTLVSSEVQSLCDNPVIHSATRLVNNTVVIYRGDYYWELIGLPGHSGGLRGPFKIWFKNMAPVYKNSSIVTCLSGEPKGVHYKFMGRQWWSWWEDGVQRTGGTDKQGDLWHLMPPNGFTAVYHDQNASGKGVSMVVAFQSIRVYYYDAGGWVWPSIGDSKGYIGGQFGEKFPPDITAAFSWPSTDNNIKYFVYLFKQDKYCFRPWISKSGKDCDEWHLNKDLFGCNKGGTVVPQEPPSGGHQTEEPPVQPAEVKPPQPSSKPPIRPTKNVNAGSESKNSGFKSETNFTLLLVSIYSILYFYKN